MRFPYIKTAACAVLITFLTSNILPQGWSAPVSEKVPLPVSFDLKIPGNLASIDSLISGRGPAVLHIQTAHGNYESQKKIQSLLHYLDQRYGFKTLFVEGSPFDLEPEAIRFFPKQMPLTMKINDELARKSIVKGSELFLAETKDAKAYGIEELETYKANGEAFKAVLRAQPETDQFVRSLDLQIGRLSSVLINKDLRAALDRLEAFQSGHAGLGERLSELSSLAQKHLKLEFTNARSQTEWPMLVRYFKVVSWEKEIQAGPLAEEKKRFFEVIKNFPRKNEIRQLLDSESPENGSAAELENLAEQLAAWLPKNFDPSAYPHLNRAFGIQLLQSEIQGRLLSEEMEHLTDLTLKQLAVNEQEEKILKELKNYSTLHKLFRLELTPADYEHVLSQKENLIPSRMAVRFQEFNTQGRVQNLVFEHLDALDSLYQKALEFYHLVKQRDEIMLRRLNEQMREKNIQKAVVVTGGFHSAPFEDYFRQAGANYALLSPRITHAPEEGERQSYIDAVFQSSTPSAKATYDTPTIALSRKRLAQLHSLPWLDRQIDSAYLFAGASRAENRDDSDEDAETERELTPQERLEEAVDSAFGLIAGSAAVLLERSNPEDQQTGQHLMELYELMHADAEQTIRLAEESAKGGITLKSGHVVVHDRPEDLEPFVLAKLLARAGEYRFRLKNLGDAAPKKLEGFQQLYREATAAMDILLLKTAAPKKGGKLFTIESTMMEDQILTWLTDGNTDLQDMRRQIEKEVEVQRQDSLDTGAMQTSISRELAFLKTFLVKRFNKSRKLTAFTDSWEMFKGHLNAAIKNKDHEAFTRLAADLINSYATAIVQIQKEKAIQAGMMTPEAARQAVDLLASAIIDYFNAPLGRKGRDQGRKALLRAIREVKPYPDLLSFIRYDFVLDELAQKIEDAEISPAKMREYITRHTVKGSSAASDVASSSLTRLVGATETTAPAALLGFSGGPASTGKPILAIGFNPDAVSTAGESEKTPDGATSPIVEFHQLGYNPNAFKQIFKGVNGHQLIQQMAEGTLKTSRTLEAFFEGLSSAWTLPFDFVLKLTTLEAHPEAISEWFQTMAYLYDFSDDDGKRGRPVADAWQKFGNKIGTFSDKELTKIQDAFHSAPGAKSKLTHDQIRSLLFLSMVSFAYLKKIKDTKKRDEALGKLVKALQKLGSEKSALFALAGNYLQSYYEESAAHEDALKETGTPSAGVADEDEVTPPPPPAAATSQASPRRGLFSMMGNRAEPAKEGPDPNAPLRFSVLKPWQEEGFPQEPTVEALIQRVEKLGTSLLRAISNEQISDRDKEELLFGVLVGTTDPAVAKERYKKLAQLLHADRNEGSPFLEQYDKFFKAVDLIDNFLRDDLDWNKQDEVLSVIKNLIQAAAEIQEARRKAEQAEAAKPQKEMLLLLTRIAEGQDRLSTLLEGLQTLPQSVDRLVSVLERLEQSGVLGAAAQVPETPTKTEQDDSTRHEARDEEAYQRFKDAFDEALAGVNRWADRYGNFYPALKNPLLSFSQSIAALAANQRTAGDTPDDRFVSMAQSDWEDRFSSIMDLLNLKILKQQELKRKLDTLKQAGFLLLASSRAESRDIQVQQISLMSGRPEGFFAVPDESGMIPIRFLIKFNEEYSAAELKGKIQAAVRYSLLDPQGGETGWSNESTDLPLGGLRVEAAGNPLVFKFEGKFPAPAVRGSMVFNLRILIDGKESWMKNRTPDNNARLTFEPLPPGWSFTRFSGNDIPKLFEFEKDLTYANEALRWNKDDFQDTAWNPTMVGEYLSDAQGRVMGFFIFEVTREEDLDAVFRRVKRFSVLPDAENRDQIGKFLIDRIKQRPLKNENVFMAHVPESDEEHRGLWESQGFSAERIENLYHIGEPGYRLTFTPEPFPGSNGRFRQLDHGTTYDHWKKAVIPRREITRLARLLRNAPDSQKTPSFEVPPANLQPGDVNESALALADLWRNSGPAEREHLLERVYQYEPQFWGKYADGIRPWLLWLLMDRDFKVRRKVVEINDWYRETPQGGKRGLMMDPELLIRHFEEPWLSIHALGQPDQGEANEQSYFNKRIALMTLLISNASLNPSDPKGSAEYHKTWHLVREYQEQTHTLLEKLFYEEAAPQIKENSEAWMRRIVERVISGGRYALGTTEKLSFWEGAYIGRARFRRDYPNSSNPYSSIDAPNRFLFVMIFTDYFVSSAPPVAAMIDLLLDQVIHASQREERPPFRDPSDPGSGEESSGRFEAREISDELLETVSPELANAIKPVMQGLVYQNDDVPRAEKYPRVETGEIRTLEQQNLRAAGAVIKSMLFNKKNLSDIHAAVQPYISAILGAYETEIKKAKSADPSKLPKLQKNKMNRQVLHDQLTDVISLLSKHYGVSMAADESIYSVAPVSAPSLRPAQVRPAVSKKASPPKKESPEKVSRVWPLFLRIFSVMSRTWYFMHPFIFNWVSFVGLVGFGWYLFYLREKAEIFGAEPDEDNFKTQVLMGFFNLLMVIGGLAVSVLPVAIFKFMKTHSAMPGGSRPREAARPIERLSPKQLEKLEERHRESGESEASDRSEARKDLKWEDEEEVLDEVRILMTEFGWPMPRKLLVDGDARPPEIRPLTIPEIRSLAKELEPHEYLRMLNVSAQLPEFYSSYAAPFLKHFGILPSWAVWFRYKQQLLDIRDQIETISPDQEVHILVHAAWNGEDAYAIAIMLDLLFPKRKFELVISDFSSKPDPEKLEWVLADSIPDFLSAGAKKYFTQKTPEVLVFHPERLGKNITIKIQQGDLRESPSYGKNLDIVIANSVLGQSIAEETGIQKSVQNASAALKPGGRLYIDNHPYQRHPAQREIVQRLIRQNFRSVFADNPREDVFTKRSEARILPEEVKTPDRFVQEYGVWKVGDFEVTEFGAAVIKGPGVWQKENGTVVRQDSGLAVPGGIPLMLPANARTVGGNMITRNGSSVNVLASPLARAVDSLVPGEKHQLHGFTDKVKWFVTAADDDSITFSLNSDEVTLNVEGAKTLADIIGKVSFTQTYKVENSTLTSRLEIKNLEKQNFAGRIISIILNFIADLFKSRTGFLRRLAGRFDKRAVLGGGYHPFYQVENIEDWTIQIPANHFWAADAVPLVLNAKPYGVLSSGLDFRHPQPLTYGLEAVLSEFIPDQNGQISIFLKNVKTGEVKKVSFPYGDFSSLLLWVPPQDKAPAPGIFSIEPLLSIPNGRNLFLSGNKEAEPLVLSPGQTHTAAWTLQTTPGRPEARSIPSEVKQMETAPVLRNGLSVSSVWVTHVLRGGILPFATMTALLANGAWTAALDQVLGKEKAPAFITPAGGYLRSELKISGSVSFSETFLEENASLQGRIFAEKSWLEKIAENPRALFLFLKAAQTEGSEKTAVTVFLPQNEKEEFPEILARALESRTAASGAELEELNALKESLLSGRLIDFRALPAGQSEEEALERGAVSEKASGAVVWHSGIPKISRDASSVHFSSGAAVSEDMPLIVLAALLSRKLGEQTSQLALKPELLKEQTHRFLQQVLPGFQMENGVVSPFNLASFALGAAASRYIATQA